MNIVTRLGLAALFLIMSNVATGEHQSYEYRDHARHPYRHEPTYNHYYAPHPPRYEHYHQSGVWPFWKTTDYEAIPVLPFTPIGRPQAVSLADRREAMIDNWPIVSPQQNITIYVNTNETNSQTVVRIDQQQTPRPSVLKPVSNHAGGPMPTITITQTQKQNKPTQPSEAELDKLAKLKQENETLAKRLTVIENILDKQETQPSTIDDVTTDTMKLDIDTE